MKEQVEKVLEQIRPFLRADGGDVELVEVKEGDGVLDRGLLNNAGNPDLRGGDELDVYPLRGHGAEHPGGITRGVLHPGAHDADLRQPGITAYLPGLNLPGHRLN